MGACFSCVDACLARTPIFLPTGPYTQTPITEQPDILDLPLRSVNVMSSHNSYLRTLQHMSSSTVEGMRIALNRGARCLELDVYRDETQPERVFVAHGKEELPRDIITTTKLPFEDAIAFIAAHAFTTTSDPLFVALELNVHRDVRACDAILRTLDAHLKPVLYTGRVTPDTPLRDLVGKVVLMCGGGTAGALHERIHIHWSAQFRNEPSTLAIPSARITEDCVRVYPAGDFKGALSLNFDAIPFLRAGATFVALNVCTNDAHMTAYATYFSESSFVSSR